MKLQLKHLAPYLPYSLKLMVKGSRANVAYMSTKRIAYCFLYGIGDVLKVRWEHASGKVKPILRPLSDLTKEIDFYGKKLNPYDEFKSVLDDDSWQLVCDYIGFMDGFKDGDAKPKMVDMPYWWVNLCFAYHFDVFGLIDEGLAIDINTI